MESALSVIFHTSVFPRGATLDLRLAGIETKRLRLSGEVSAYAETTLEARCRQSTRLADAMAIGASIANGPSPTALFLSPTANR